MPDSKEMKIGSQRDICTLIVTSILFKISKFMIIDKKNPQRFPIINKGEERTEKQE